MFLLKMLVGYSPTRTVYVPAQCMPFPAVLAQPMPVRTQAAPCFLLLKTLESLPGKGEKHVADNGQTEQ